jgi:hypothetical protein
MAVTNVDVAVADAQPTQGAYALLAYIEWRLELLHQRAFLAEDQDSLPSLQDGDAIGVGRNGTVRCDWCGIGCCHIRRAQRGSTGAEPNRAHTRCAAGIEGGSWGCGEGACAQQLHGEEDGHQKTTKLTMLHPRY